MIHGKYRATVTELLPDFCSIKITEMLVNVGQTLCQYVQLVRYDGIMLHYCVVCRYIDEGKNPQLYTKDCMEKALAKNEAVKGKIDVLKVGMRHNIKINVHIINR